MAESQITIDPFIKWAGGKRWLTRLDEFRIPEFTGNYIEPFLGGGAVFFHVNPKYAILSDINERLINTYIAIKQDWGAVWKALKRHSRNHSKVYYYQERSRKRSAIHERAAQFLYLNRACWNGLYRENLNGAFNVPVGTKSTIIFDYDDFEIISNRLQSATIHHCDFEETIDQAKEGDFLFVDPPYTTTHNFNGFVKYNQSMFSWGDQLRLQESLIKAGKRGAKILLTNAHHKDVIDLYKKHAEIVEVPRVSKISGKPSGRRQISEALIYM